MSGLIPQAEYLRVVRERDNLRNELDWLRSEIGVSDDEEVTVAVASYLGATGCKARILVALMRRPGQFITYRRLALSVFGEDSAGALGGTINQQNNFQTHLCKLRRLLRERGGPPDAIETSFGFGVRLTVKAHQWASEAILGAFPETTKTEEAAHERLTAAR
jgi:DNA-binding response OmpR family regulator